MFIYVVDALATANKSHDTTDPRSSVQNLSFAPRNRRPLSISPLTDGRAFRRDKRCSQISACSIRKSLKEDTRLLFCVPVTVAVTARWSLTALAKRDSDRLVALTHTVQGCRGGGSISQLLFAPEIEIYALSDVTLNW